MKLYGYYRSSASYRIRILLNLKDVPWEYEAVLLNKGEQKSADFLARNPSGLVPVLDTGTSSFGQSLAIAEYLEETVPQPPLLPADPLARAEVREIVTIIGCDIHPLQNLRVLNWLRDEHGADDDAVKRWIHRWIGGGFTALEARLTQHGSGGKFCYGESPTLADAWLIPQMYNARRWELDVSPFPTLRSIDAHCRSLPAFANAEPERQPDAPTA